jgi:hypothetical protein
MPKYAEKRQPCRNRASPGRCRGPIGSNFGRVRSHGPGAGPLAAKGGQTGGKKVGQRSCILAAFAYNTRAFTALGALCFFAEFAQFLHRE